ncbi:hypothetical protein [Kitasatospora sp. NPDC088346]|uniref:HD domain-containing protein n=1 Tax=Kitasatospora sp. NPDC088346 TaxID=3364073 RepID=UPI00381C15CD
MRDSDTWNTVDAATVHGPVVQARDIGHLSIHHAPPSEPPPAVPAEAWVRQALGSTVWQHVPAGRDAAPLRELVGSAVARLAVLRDDAERQLTADPWRDPTAAGRFLERIEWLLGEPEPTPALDLYPAEAALFVLAPFLHRVHGLRAAALRACAPGSPGSPSAAPCWRTWSPGQPSRRTGGRTTSRPGGSPTPAASPPTRTSCRPGPSTTAGPAPTGRPRPVPAWANRPTTSSCGDCSPTGPTRP